PLAVEPADDERAVQAGQVLPGVRLAGPGADQQAVPGDVHGSSLPSPGGDQPPPRGRFFDRPLLGLFAGLRFWKVWAGMRCPRRTRTDHRGAAPPGRPTCGCGVRPLRVAGRLRAAVPVGPERTDATPARRTALGLRARLI